MPWQPNKWYSKRKLSILQSGKHVHSLPGQLCCFPREGGWDSSAEGPGPLTTSSLWSHPSAFSCGCGPLHKLLLEANSLPRTDLRPRHRRGVVTLTRCVHLQLYYLRAKGKQPVWLPRKLLETKVASVTCRSHAIKRHQLAEWHLAGSFPSLSLSAKIRGDTTICNIDN